MDVSAIDRARAHVRRSDAAIGAWAVGLLVIVATGGSAGWALIRAAVVVAMGIGARLATDQHRRLGGATLLVLGVVGIDVGVTYGIRFLIDDGPGHLTLAGVVVLAAGLALAAIGGRWLVEGHGRSRFATIPLLVLVVALLVWNTAPAVLATNVPPIERGSATPATFGMDAEAVRFRAADGTQLAGWYVPSDNGAAVVLRHGAGSTATANLEQASVIAGHGFGVLVTDARGHGESDGRAMDFGWYGDDDITGAVSFLEAQPGVDADRIGVVGFSMGGEEAIGALAADDRIRTVVAEGVTVRTDADQAWFDDVYGLRGRLQQALEWTKFTLTDALTDVSKPTSLADAAAAAAPRRILLITAGEVADEGHAAEHISAAAPGRVTIRDFPDAGHTDGFAIDPDMWETTVIAWLDAELLAALGR